MNNIQVNCKQNNISVEREFVNTRSTGKLSQGNYLGLYGLW
jgi:hypothetical protein